MGKSFMTNSIKKEKLAREKAKMILKFSIRLSSTFLLCLAFSTQSSEHDSLTLEFSYRASVIANLAYLDASSSTFLDSNSNWASADQESFRMMVNGQGKRLNWEVHIKTARQSSSTSILSPSEPFASVFRYDNLSNDRIDEQSPSRNIRWLYDIDRLNVSYQGEQHSLTLGRQALDFGSGRIWQAFNVFGGFRPTDLDTVYKPGIDALHWQYYPESLSTLSFTYSLSAKDAPFDNSFLLSYQRLIAENWQVGFLAGQVLEKSLVGISIESDHQGLGYRGEIVVYQSPRSNELETHAVLGFDFQWDNGLLLIAEAFFNDYGTVALDELGTRENPLLESGIFNQIGRIGIGMGLSKELSPLIQGSFTTLVSPLEESISSLHQVAINSSLSDDTELVFGFLFGIGPGRKVGDLGSEYGSLPSSISLRLSHYF